MIRQAFLILLLILSFAHTQTLELPTLLDISDDFELAGTGFDPSVTYELSLLSPAGEAEAVELEPDAEGELSYSGTLDASGIWTLTVTGGGFEQTQRVVAYRSTEGQETDEVEATDGTLEAEPTGETASPEDVPSSDPSAEAETSETPALTPLPLLSDDTSVDLDTSPAGTTEAAQEEAATEDAPALASDATQDETQADEQREGDSDAGAQAPSDEADVAVEETEGAALSEGSPSETQSNATDPAVEGLGEAAQAEGDTQASDEAAAREETASEADNTQEDVAAQAEATAADEDNTADEATATQTETGESAETAEAELSPADAEDAPDTSDAALQAEETTPDEADATDEESSGANSTRPQPDAPDEAGTSADEAEASATDEDETGDEASLQSAPDDASPDGATEGEQTGDEESASEAEALEETPEDVSETAPAPSGPELPQNAVIEGDAVMYDGNGNSWELGFPAGSGPLGAVLEREEAVYLGHGNSLLELDPGTGEVQERWILGAPVTGLEPAGDDLLISTTFDNGLIERYTLSGGEIQETVRFGTDPELFGWLRAEAEVENPAERLARDPSNPWLYLAAGQAETDPEAARERYTQAIERAETFYDLAGLSRALYGVGEDGLARRAFDTALSDFAARGYSPRLLTDLELHEAYNFPLRPFQQAIRNQNLAAAEFWAEWMQYLVSANVPETRRALLDYAALLRDQGQRDEAALWRDRAQQSRQATLTGSLDRLFRSVGRVGWYCALAVFVGIIMLYLTLVFKYWVPQGVMLSRQRDSGKAPGPLARLWAVRYFSTTEKLVIVFMYAVILALIGLAIWANRTDALPVAARSGTLASAPARDFVSTGPISGERAAFLQGYAAQVAGDETAAETAYAQAQDYAPALNNQGALLNSESLYVRALELSPGLDAAQYNTGRETRGFPFEREYLVGEPVLAVPDPLDMQIALGGSWQRSFVDTFINPWTGLRGGTPPGLTPWLWTALQVLLLILIAIAVVWLFFPRPRLARNAPRTFLYHLFALLIPGSGLADELWGALLLIPWAIFGIDALSNLFSWGFGLGLGLQRDLIILSVIYLINLVAFIVEFISYSRRMRELKKNNPAQARVFGMIK